MSRSGIHANRDFLLLWSGNAASLVGFHGARIAYPLLVLAITGSAAMAGWVGFALSIPSLIFQLHAGVIADYAHRIRILMVCQAVGLAAAALAAVAVAARLPGLAGIVIVTAFVEGSAYVFVGVSELAAVRDVVTESQRPAAFSFLEAEQPIAILIGRAAGAAVYGVARWLPFVADALSYLFCLVTLSLIRSPTPATPTATDSADRGTRRAIAEGIRVVWNEPLLRISTAMFGGSNIVIQIVLLLILVELRDSGRPAWTVGVVLASAGVGGILGASTASWLTTRFSAPSVYRAAMWAWTALLVPIAVTTHPMVLAVCWCGVGGVGVVSNVASTVYQVEVIPDDVLGRAVATTQLVFNSAVALGALGAGYLLAALGAVTTRWTALSAMLVLALCTSVFIARHPIAEDDVAELSSTR